MRAVDVRDPYHPQDVAFFVPAPTRHTDFRCGSYQGLPNVCRNNVATDDRGFGYIVDRANTGLHVLKLTGRAAEIVGLGHGD